MGKNDKVFTENGKAAKSAVQKYWEQQRQRTAEKNKLAKQENQEKRLQQQNGLQNQSNKQEQEEEDIVSKEQIELLKQERENRKQGNYNTQINVKQILKQGGLYQNKQSDDLSSSQDKSKKGIYIPGFGANFITELDAQRNKKEMERKKELHRLMELKSQQKKEKLKLQEEQGSAENNANPLKRPAEQQQNQINEQNLNPVQKNLQTQPIKQWVGVIEGESTVKKSKIDLTKEKISFIPRQIINNNQQIQKNNLKPAIQEKSVLQKEYEELKKQLNLK